MGKKIPLMLNSILFTAGIIFIVLKLPFLYAVCLLLISLLFIWSFRYDSSTAGDSDDSSNEKNIQEPDLVMIDLSLKLQELTESNQQLTYENNRLSNELSEYKKEQQKNKHPFYSCPLTSALPVYLDSFVSDYLKSRASIFDDNKLHPKYYCSSPAASTYMSEAALSIIFNNVLDNIYKFSSRDENVYITITDYQNDNLIIFRNEGEGLSESETELIFRPNYQGNNKMSGNGLGLTQVKAIIEDFGGQIWAKSSISSGFSLYIQLPCQPQS